ncbi:MAG: class I SAM-dependent methyltransferase [DPANN group archaeon]|nr:class I SAM-dependent methyltransferase [DPANN group archaeon]
MKKKKINKLIGEFYNKYPFPGFDLDNYNSKESLYFYANTYGKLLADQIPENVKIIDFGCGTGRHSCLLGIKNRKILGTDISDRSLKIANKLKKKLGFKNVNFKKQDLFNLKINHKADYIICIGVLHHTYNIEKSFEEIITYLKPNGYIIIGLYNTYGRLITKLLRALNKISFNFIEKLDFYINNIAKSKVEKDMWRYDMYRCPFESTISIGKVLKIFKRNNIEYINSFPNKIALNEEVWPRECEKLFSKTKEGKWWEHAIIQFKWIFKEYKAGGLFMMIGRKKAK